MTPVILADMLDARERRVQRQRELLAQYHAPLICFTMNIAGPVKDSPLIRRGFSHGGELLRRIFLREKLRPLHTETVCAPTGCEGFYVLDAEPLFLKSLTGEIEDHTPLGRLFDMDVLDRNGEKIDREVLGLPSRRCLLCGEDAKACARSRAHTVAELQTVTKRMLAGVLREADAEAAAQAACRALLYEVAVTPKPGLVDRANSGSHTDMDMFHFMSSAAALWPYFAQCARTGMDTAGEDAPRTLAALRWTGRQAEGAMLAATGGVNTHKGAIFSLGIACAALGRLPQETWCQPERVLSECAAMARGLTEQDFAGLTVNAARTMGEKLFLRYGITGVRGQAEQGFPAVRQAGLPKLEQGMAAGYGWNRSGCAALLAILAAADDTNLIARGGREAQQDVSRQIAALLAREPFPDMDTLAALDREFIRQNLSPGGSADLLAISYFLYFLKQKETNYSLLAKTNQA